MGPTPTPTQTLGMRLSCNFANVYTIVYHVQYTYTCTRAHPQRTSSRGKRESDKSPRTLSASWTGRARRGTPSRLPRAPDTPTYGPVELKLYSTPAERLMLVWAYTGTCLVMWLLSCSVHQLQVTTTTTMFQTSLFTGSTDPDSPSTIIPSYALYSVFYATQ